MKKIEYIICLDEVERQCATENEESAERIFNKYLKEAKKMATVRKVQTRQFGMQTVGGDDHKVTMTIRYSIEGFSIQKNIAEIIIKGENK